MKKMHFKKCMESTGPLTAAWPCSWSWSFVNMMLSGHFVRSFPYQTLPKHLFSVMLAGVAPGDFYPETWILYQKNQGKTHRPSRKIWTWIFISKLRVHQLHRWVEAQLHGFSSRKGAQGSEYFGRVAVKTQGPKDYVKFNLWGLLWFGFRILLTAWCYMKCKNDWPKKNKLTYPTIYSIPMHFMETYYTSWWFQPLWKILVKMGIFPK